MLATLLCLLVHAPNEGALAFRGATLHTAEGPPLLHGVLVIRDGKIVAVGGPDTPLPADAKVFDVTGKTILPGLVDTHSHVGIYPRPNVPAHSDGNEGSGPVQSGLRALDAIWPDDPGFRMALAGGVTCANIMPGSGNVIGGQTLYLKLRGKTIDEMRLLPATVLGGLKMANGENPKSFNFGRSKAPPGTRMKLAALQRAEFVKAREYQAKWDAFRKAKSEGKQLPEPERDPALDPLVEVLQRKRTVHFHCHRADDILSAVRLAREFNFEIVLQHATEGYRVARELAEAKIPVSLTLVDSPGGKLETMGLLEENAALLRKAGVQVAINTDDSITESRFFLRTGAIAVRGGMSEDDAVKALTLSPARMLHLDDRLGSLKVGKDADFILLSGSPFSVYTHVLQTYIDGQLVFDRQKHRDWTYQAGGFALLDSERVPPTPATIKPLPRVQSPERPADAPKPTASTNRLAILAGRIHTGRGETILQGVVLVENGLITAVGPRNKLDLPAGIPILTAAVVTPGLIDAACCLGVSGGANVPADQDQDEKSDPNQADLRILDGFNPDEGLLEFVRREGVTTVHAMPGRTNILAGQTGVFKTHGRTVDSMTLRFPYGLLVNLGEIPKAAYPNKLPTTRMGSAALLRQAFSRAQGYARKTASSEKPPTDAKLETLRLALARELPVLFSAHRADDLLTALRIAKEFNLDARLHLATEAYLVADELARARVPVLLHPTMQRIGSSMETFHTQLSNASLLASKKIPLALGTSFEGYVPKTRVLRHEAALAAVHGLGHERALTAITFDAARLLGIDRTRGSIEKGKVADLVLYDGDCFEHTTHVTHTLLEGRIVYDRAAYLALPFARRALPLSGAGAGGGCCLGIW